MPKPAIEALGLGKCYRLSHPQQANMSETLQLMARQIWPFSRTAPPVFWALSDVSFELAQGAALGIVGANGAGKSTLLKILSRITAPTVGKARLCGRTASLLEVGAGFHPELSGRENIFLNGALLGLSKAEIRRRFATIVEESGVAPFLDMPVKRYSSGMVLRLAFAVALKLDAEILLLDEVLAVGDAEFRAFCQKELLAQRANGRTLIYVTHNLESLRTLTNQALWLKAGRVVAFGESSEILARYENEKPAF